MCAWHTEQVTVQNKQPLQSLQALKWNGCCCVAYLHARRPPAAAVGCQQVCAGSELLSSCLQGSTCIPQHLLLSSNMICNCYHHPKMRRTFACCCQCRWQL